jgi:hypothetical protein
MLFSQYSISSTQGKEMPDTGKDSAQNPGTAQPLGEMKLAVVQIPEKQDDPVLISGRYLD